MAESYESRSWVDAYAKLPKRNKVLIAVGIIGAISIALILFFAFMFGFGPFKLKGYPDANLSEVGEAQTYRHSIYDSLPVQVRFLGTNYGVNIGGKMLHEEEDGATFLYDNDTMIVTAVSKVGDDFKSTIEGKLMHYVGGEDTVSYAEAVSDKGYFNCLYFYYHAGALNLGGNDYKLLSYLHPTEEGDLLYMIVVTSDDNRLRDDRDLLNRMMETFAFYSTDPDGNVVGGTETDTKTSASSTSGVSSASGTSSTSSGN